MNKTERNEKIISLNRILSDMYGFQGWWPLTAEKGKAPVYHPEEKNRPVSDAEAFEIIVGSILTQNTAWRNAEKAVMNLSRQDMLNIRAIAKSDTQQLEETIRPSGYYRQKAGRLKEISLHILENRGIAGLRALSAEKLRALLLSWKGIGPETADSILCYAFQRPVFVVDKYTARLFEKLHLPHSSYYEIQAAVHEALQARAAEYGDLHARIVKISVRKEEDRLPGVKTVSDPFR
ncbi:MAG: hypothetical protein V2I97_08045 [Desulfococcaceae bacterium]|jgi:endonuclease-3 related protein|nr:hypothetical protein [Desulfococcaceae bacterium]